MGGDTIDNGCKTWTIHPLDLESFLILTRIISCVFGPSCSLVVCLEPLLDDPSPTKARSVVPKVA